MSASAIATGLSFSRFRCVAVSVLCVLIACGSDVNIGGPGDAGEPLSLDCEPCVFNEDCHAGAACGAFSGDAYCATLCPQGTECASGQTCSSVNIVGSNQKACLPASGKCPTAPPPPGPDGGVATKCGTLNGPTIASACHSCKAGVGTCQANGCYGGWWCNTTNNECVRPPKCS